MEEVAVNELNTVLKGELMAVGAYERFIEDVGDTEIKSALRDIQSVHRNHADEIAFRIREIGGNPEYSTGFAGFMASAKAAMKEMTAERNTAEVLKEAYEGEDKGIAKAREIVTGDLDKESAVIVDRILSKDHELMTRVVNMLAETEEKQ